MTAGRLCIFKSGPPKRFDPAFIHLIDSVGEVEPSLVMGDADDDLAARLEISKESGGITLDIPWSMVSHVSDGDKEKRKQYNLQKK